jgi:hypothetical protein
MDHRLELLQSWLEGTCGIKNSQLIPLAGDASFRRYFRVPDQHQSYVVMDAPPERENCISFIAIANALRAINIKVPEIFASDLKQGFLLLSDFGDRLFLKELNTQNAKSLYGSALDTLAELQTCHEVVGWTVPRFTVKFMRDEMDLFKEWFLHRYLQISEQNSAILNPFFDWLTITIGKQPYVFMHRDYHSANLMLLPENVTGVLDFQDAFIGPVTYDLASLLRDCYIAWPEPLVTELAKSYLLRLQTKNNLINISSDEFLFWFDCMSMQRHLKALITFSRKYLRDNNANYLQHIPRTLNYLRNISQQHAESKILSDFLENQVITKVGTRCVQ